MKNLVTIAHFKSDFTSKFGIPRQSGIVKKLTGTVVFEPEYRNPEALRGLEEFSHLWLIWGFSATEQEGWSPTVRPPRLGGNSRMGVFATRSPFRPNSIGLSSVEIHSIEKSSDLGIVVHVLGADLMNGTPIYDIKPYLPYTDSCPEATGGFASDAPKKLLQVVIPEQCPRLLSESQANVLREILALDPRPSYQNDPNRVYGMKFSDLEVKFHVDNNILTVLEISK